MILLIVGFLIKGLSILVTIGGVLLLVGIVLAVLGATGHAVGGRTWY